MPSASINCQLNDNKQDINISSLNAHFTENNQGIRKRSGFEAVDIGNDYLASTFVNNFFLLYQLIYNGRNRLAGRCNEIGNFLVRAKHIDLCFVIRPFTLIFCMQQKKADYPLSYTFKC